METGVAKFPIQDWDVYETQLSKRLGLDNTLTRAIINKAKQDPKRVVLADAENLTVLKAAQQVRQEKIATPILLGNVKRIKQLIQENQLDLAHVEVLLIRCRLEMRRKPARMERLRRPVF